MYVLFKQKITLLETTFFIVLLKNVWGEKDKEHYLSVTEVSLNLMKNKTEIDKNFIRIKIASD